jgi:hypothetical protein
MWTGTHTSRVRRFNYSGSGDLLSHSKQEKLTKFCVKIVDLKAISNSSQLFGIIYCNISKYSFYETNVNKGENFNPEDKSFVNCFLKCKVFIQAKLLPTYL